MCSGHHDGGQGGPCCLPDRLIRGFLQPWLLLLLSEHPAHGYELMERLSQKPWSPDTDPGFLYRTLRHFEEQGLVQSRWDTSGSGPARRIYELTEDGLDYLHAWTASIRSTRERLGRFLSEVEAQFGAEL